MLTNHQRGQWLNVVFAKSDNLPISRVQNISTPRSTQGLRSAATSRSLDIMNTRDCVY